MSFQRRGRLWVPEAPNLILGRGPCPRPTIELELVSAPMRWEGWFDVKLIESGTGRIKRHLRWRNLITNAALDGLGSSKSPNSMTQVMAVGTGGTAPAVTDTVLQSEIGTRIGRSLSGNGSGPSFAYWYYRVVGTFLEPNANGTLTEIGLFEGTPGTMWTRQLFKDGTGTPTAITKTASDQLQVTYEWRLYSPTADATGVVVISGVNYNYTVRAANIGDTSTWGATGALINFNLNGTAASANAYETDVLGSTSGTPAGTASQSGTNTEAAYVGGTYIRDITYVWDPGLGNFATGIGSMLYGAANTSVARPFQCSFAPKIPKDSTKRLTLVARIAWGRYP